MTVPIDLFTLPSILVMQQDHLCSFDHYQLLYLLSPKDTQALEGHLGVLRTPWCIWVITEVEVSNFE